MAAADPSARGEACYFRAKIWRRLQGAGTVAARNALRLTGEREDRKDFEWLLREIAEGGTEAVICEGRLMDGLFDQEVQALFNAARDEDDQAVMTEARAPVATPVAEPAFSGPTGAKRSKPKAGAQRIVAIDLFGANSCQAAY